MGVHAYNTDYNKLPVNDILIGDRANMQVCVVPHSSMYFVSCICMYAHAIRGCLRGRQLGINCCARLLWPTQSACAGSLGQHTGLCISPRKLAAGELLASFPPPPLERLGPTRRFAYFPAQIGCRLETPEPGSFRRLMILIKHLNKINKQIKYRSSHICRILEQSK